MRECVRVGGEGYAVRGSVPIFPAWRVRDISAVVGPTMKSSEAIGGLLDDLGSLMDPSVGYVVAKRAQPAVCTTATAHHSRAHIRCAPASQRMSV